MTAGADSLERLWSAFTTTSALVSKLGDDLVADLGLTSARLLILDVSAAAGPRTVSQIARALGLSRQAVQRVSDDLVRLGLAVYVGNPDHARAQLLVMTDGGRAAQAEAVRRKASWRAKVADGLDPAWLDMASELLTLVARRAAKTSRAEHS